MANLKSSHNKALVAVFSMREQNKTVLDKMGSDIVDISDTLTTLVSELGLSK